MQTVDVAFARPGRVFYRHWRVGMSGLARILKGLGHDVGGSDTAASAYTAQLEASGYCC
ncbi:MAG: Mur ligase domain-containing protein [Vampirovibrionales bacterium]